MRSLVEQLPSWAGTFPQWGMLVTVLVVAIRVVPVLRKQTLDSQAGQVKEYAETCAALRAEVSELMDKLHACERQCAKDKKDLQEELHGMQKQRLAEQGAIMRAIVRMSGDPEVKKQLELLETMEATMAGRNIIDLSRGAGEDDEIAGS